MKLIIHSIKHGRFYSKSDVVNTLQLDFYLIKLLAADIVAILRRSLDGAIFLYLAEIWRILECAQSRNATQSNLSSEMFKDISLSGPFLD